MKELVDHYGGGITNVDLKTKIHYGVIHQNEVLQAWADSSEPFYGDLLEVEGPDMEPLSFIYNKEGYQAESDDYGDIMITKSPFYTRCQYCSPCAPGAGYLMTPDPLGPKTYCFGDDWFEDGKAPYPIFKVIRRKK